MKRVVIHWSRHVVCRSKQANDGQAKFETSFLDLGQTVYLFARSN
jgi:hypothetical protein